MSVTNITEDDIKQQLIKYAKFEVATLSTGVLPQTSLFNTTIKNLIEDCLKNKDVFTETQLENIQTIAKDIYGKK